MLGDLSYLKINLLVSAKTWLNKAVPLLQEVSFIS